MEGFLFKQSLESEVLCIGTTSLCANDHSEICGENKDWFEIDPDTICQFTGLTDKNDNKIGE